MVVGALSRRLLLAGAGSLALVPTATAGSSVPLVLRAGRARADGEGQAIIECAELLGDLADLSDLPPDEDGPASLRLVEATRLVAAGDDVAAAKVLADLDRSLYGLVAHLTQARIHIRNGKLKSAVKRCRDLYRDSDTIDLFTEHMVEEIAAAADTSLWIVANVYAQIDRMDEARQYWRLVPEDSPRSADALLAIDPPLDVEEDIAAFEQGECPQRWAHRLELDRALRGHTRRLRLIEEARRKVRRDKPGLALLDREQERHGALHSARFAALCAEEAARLRTWIEAGSWLPYYT